VVDVAQRPILAYGLAGCRPAAQLASRLWSAAPQRCIDPAKEYSAEVQTTKGAFTIRLSAHDAPVTVNNFIVLAQQGYFTGLHFFESKDWEIRSGDPTNTGHGGPGYSLPAEPVAGGEKWLAGSVGMARVPEGGLSGGQFFITRTVWPGGNPSISYNHFGMVQAGFDNLAQLSSSDRILGVEVIQQ
ncbi:MAG: peptidylprolyl isomerase, partial [Candidatus Dormibacteraceae bacterium]